jgi:hypothetical protein
MSYENLIKSISQEQIIAAVRFNECVEDGQGHDVSADLMSELTALGLVICSEQGHEQTDLMIEVKEILKVAASNTVKQINNTPIDIFKNINKHDPKQGFSIRNKINQTETDIKMELLIKALRLVNVGKFGDAKNTIDEAILSDHQKEWMRAEINMILGFLK